MTFKKCTLIFKIFQNFKNNTNLKNDHKFRKIFTNLKKKSWILRNVHKLAESKKFGLMLGWS